MPKTYTYIAELAVASLLEEVETTPKPGLVDKENSGAHTDMDYPLFVKSSNSLKAYFEECAKLGAMNLAFEDLARELRKAGLLGEKRMFEATKGINTQKGLVFSMGVICAGWSSLITEKSQIDDYALKERFACISKALLEKDIAASTNGLKVLENTGVGGIRKEAISGFSTCFEQGTRTLRTALKEGKGYNEACVLTLLALMSTCQDSNVVHRGGKDALDFIKTRSAEILAQDYDQITLLEKTSQFDDECIKRNISPGGSADLLALTLMIHKITAQKER